MKKYKPSKRSRLLFGLASTSNTRHLRGSSNNGDDSPCPSLDGSECHDDASVLNLNDAPTSIDDKNAGDKKESDTSSMSVCESQKQLPSPSRSSVMYGSSNNCEESPCPPLDASETEYNAFVSMFEDADTHNDDENASHKNEIVTSSTSVCQVPKPLLNSTRDNVALVIAANTSKGKTYQSKPESACAKTNPLPNVVNSTSLPENNGDSNDVGDTDDDNSNDMNCNIGDTNNANSMSANASGEHLASSDNVADVTMVNSLNMKTPSRPEPASVRRNLFTNDVNSGSQAESSLAELFPDDLELQRELELFEKTFLPIPLSPEVRDDENEQQADIIVTVSEEGQQLDNAQEVTVQPAEATVASAGNGQKPRTRQINKEQWKAVITKNAVNKGLEHVGSKGQIIPAKTLKKACLRSCRFKCLTKFLENERNIIFKNYWSLGSKERQWDFMNKLTKLSTPMKTKNPGGKPLKSRSTQFFLTLDGKKQVRVCSKMFHSTLGVSDKISRTLAAKLSRSPIISPSKRGRHSNKRKAQLQPIRNTIREHIASFRPVDSRLCRANTRRKYLGANLSIKKMHVLYKKWMVEKYPEKPVGSYRQYNELFNSQFNLGFHVPRKDQCELCNIDRLATPFIKTKYQDKIAVHNKNKEVAYALCQADKKAAVQDKTIVYAPFDQEKVLYTPKSETGCLYYLRKLSVLNFTVFDGAAYQGYCYVWNQTEAKRGANEIASCLMEFMAARIKDSEVHEFRFWSDNCSGQNKNKFLFAMYTHASVKFNVKIIHRFLEKGHTHNEGDSMHACIDARVRSEEIFTPQQWYSLIEDAKQEGKRYIVTPLVGKVQDFHTFAEKHQQWNRHKEVKWKQVREIIFDPILRGTVKIRMDLSDPEAITINVTKKTKGRPINLANHHFSSAYEGPIPLPAPLAQDLATLCKNLTIPAEHHSVYTALPGFPAAAIEELEQFVDPRTQNRTVVAAAPSDSEEEADQNNIDDTDDTDYEEWYEFTATQRKTKKQKKRVPPPDGSEEADDLLEGEDETDEDSV